MSSNLSDHIIDAGHLNFINKFIPYNILFIIINMYTFNEIIINYKKYTQIMKNTFYGKVLFASLGKRFSDLWVKFILNEQFFLFC